MKKRKREVKNDLQELVFWWSGCVCRRECGCGRRFEENQPCTPYVCEIDFLDSDQ